MGEGRVEYLKTGFFSGNDLKANPKIRNKTKELVKVKTLSAEILGVSFDLVDRRPINVWLKGSAMFIAKGEYYW